MPQQQHRSKKPAVQFPLRVASIDTGSNGIRFAAAEFTAPSVWKPLATERIPVRLGRSVFVSGRMESQAMENAVAGFKRFAEKMRALNISRYRALATSAVRESANGAAFIKRIKKETGITLQIISGGEEARYAYRAVSERLALGSGRWILVDLGGGSVEVSLVDDSGILWSESHAMGAIRLAEALAGEETEPGRFKTLLADYLSVLRVPQMAKSGGALAGFIATGGNIEALARLGNSRPDPRGVSILGVSKLRSIVGQLSRLSFRERMENLGLNDDRADVILPAAMVYLRLAELAGATTILVPFVGLKDGILLDLVDELVGQDDHAALMDRKMAGAALSLGRRYLFDEPHATHVARLALSLFDQLRELHKQGEKERRMLHVAALLHDIGMFISEEKHHKHSYYLIANAMLPGFTLRQLAVVANIARYHRKSEPSEAHEAFRALDKDDRHRVMRLAGILRIADALDREHRQNVASVKVTIEDDAVVLLCAGKGELLLERWAIKKKAGLFSRYFSCNVRVRNVGE